MQPRRIFMPVACGILVAIALSPLALAPSRAQGSGALIPLPSRMAANAERYLPGVVGEPVPAFPIDPGLAALAAGTRTYKIVSGDNAGQTETHVIAALPRDLTGTRWRYTVGDRTVFLQAIAGNSLGIVSEQDADQGVITHYNPPEPLLIAGMNAGDTRTMKIDVTVYDLNDPEALQHSGSVDLTLTYVGAYKVTVPAGTYAAALLRWEYKGKVGPATIEDIQARFFAPDAGLVAMAGKRDIAAMLIYNDQTKVGKVLQTP
jgi:hypothetical protein